MTRTIDVAVVGAGPYGLSIGAHLRERGANIRVFGSPMQTWQEAMPAGMCLKSEGFASSLSAPRGELTLGAYCREHATPYADTGLPVSVELFTAYGRAFQERFVPDLVQTLITAVEPAPDGFRLCGGNDGEYVARQVVIASGIRSFDYLPPELKELPSDYLSHSVKFGTAAHLRGKDVIVVGAGASATDMAAFLRAQGANVTLLTRRKTITFQRPLGERSLYRKIRRPMTGLGPGWKSLLCVYAPLFFHAMPEAFRVDVVRRYLGPAPAWFVRSAVEGHVPYIVESRVGAASVQGNRAALTLTGADGAERVVTADHVVAATGYRVDVDRLTFLSESIRQGLRLADRAPALSRNFESSVPGLYFVGTASANSFGPMLRFVYGADFASHRVASHLISRLRRSTASAGVRAASITADAAQ